MASGFPGGELGFSDRGGGAGGSLLKRTLADMESQHQHQHMQMKLQHALLLRSVKQRTLAAPFSVVPQAIVGSQVFNSLSTAPQSLSSAFVSASSSGFGYPRRSTELVSASATMMASPVTEKRSSGSMRDQLQELERQLFSDEGDENESSASGSAVTYAEFGDSIQPPQLAVTPQPTVVTAAAAAAAANHQSPSPTNSSSSTVSSSASFSPPCVPSPSTSRQILLDTASAIGEGNLEMASANLAVIRRAANPRGDAEQRLTALMYATLFSRLNNPQAGSSHEVAELRTSEQFAATQMLYDLSPCFKLAFIAANSAILEATRDEPNIHILDFEVGQGSQYAALLHALAERRRHCPTLQPPAIRITAIADPWTPFTNINSDNLRGVGERIEKMAETAGIKLRFSVVFHRAADLDASVLGCGPGEALVVNLAFVLSRVADESVSPDNPRDVLLRRVRALQPCLVALAEQEINTSTAAFRARFAEACGHYGSLLESLEATVKSGSERERAEAGLARRAVNAVAREGTERVERCEVLGKWRARMSMAGFKAVQLGSAVVESVKSRLTFAGPNPGFSLKEEFGGSALGFGWRGRVLTVSSAWR